MLFTNGQAGDSIARAGQAEGWWDGATSRGMKEATLNNDVGLNNRVMSSVY